MKVACLISGQPRFCKSFDVQLNNLKNDQPIDWFVHIWNSSDSVQNGKICIPPDLLNTSTDHSKQYIENRLPSNHRLINLVCSSEPNVDHILEKKYIPAGWPKPEHIYLMYYGVFLANNLKLHHEQINGKYDLVIRTRPDISLSKELDLVSIKNDLDLYPNKIITPKNNRHGPNTNDQFAIGTSDAINKYANIANCLDSLYNRGAPFGPEALLFYHLKDCGILDQPGDFDAPLREFYKIENNVHVIDLGTWQ